MAVDEKALEAAYEQSREVEEYDITEKGLRRILEKYVTARQPTAPVAPGELPTREEIRRELAGIYIGTPYEVLTAQADYVLNLITTQAAFGKYAPVASPEQATAAVAPNNEDDSCQNKSSGPAKRSASRLSSTATHAEDSTTQIPSQTSVGSPSMNAKASTGTELRTCSSTDFMVTDEEWRLLQRQATAAVSPGELDEKAMQAALGAVADFHGDDDIRVARAVSAYLTAAAPVAPGELPTREALARGLFGATYERVGWLHGSESGHEAAFLQADYVLSLITTREAALRQEVERLTASRKRMVADLDGATVRKAMAESALADARQEIERLKAEAKDPFETRDDGERVRKDRWEQGLRAIASYFKIGVRGEWEIDDAVKAALGGTQRLAELEAVVAERDQLRQEIAETKSGAELVKVEYDKHAKALESERDQLKRELETETYACMKYRDAVAKHRDAAANAEARCVELGKAESRAMEALTELLADLSTEDAGTHDGSDSDACEICAAVARAYDAIQKPTALSSQPQPEAQKPTFEQVFGEVQPSTDESPFEELMRRVGALETVVRGLCEAGELRGIGAKPSAASQGQGAPTSPKV